MKHISLYLILIAILASCNTSPEVTPETTSDKVKGSYYADMKINELAHSILMHLNIETSNGLLLSFDSTDVFSIPEFGVGLSNLHSDQIGLNIGLVEIDDVRITGWNSGNGEYAGVFDSFNQTLSLEFLIHKTLGVDTVRISAVKVP